MSGPWILRWNAWTAIVFVVGCSGGAQKPPSTNIEDTPWEVRVESPLDTVNYAEDQDTPISQTAEPVLEMPKVVEERSPASPPVVASTPAVPRPEEFTPGWRAQIFASESMANADREAEKARKRFTEPVYVEFQPPLYKVRVGDFLTKAEAQSMATRAKAEGWSDTWVVEALVRQRRP